MADKKIQGSVQITSTLVSADGTKTVTVEEINTGLTKLSNIESGAEVNVQSDWNASSGDALILNKPNLATVATSGAYSDLSGTPSLGTAAACNTGTSSGNVPVLDSNGKLADSVLPSVAITDTYEAATEAAMLALSAQKGDICIRSDLNKSFVLSQAPASTLANWKELKTPTDAVLSVCGKTGAVTLSASDVGAAASSHSHTVSNISDFPASMPASDVYSWAKASTKPSYTLDEVSDGSSRKLSNYLPLSGGTITGAILPSPDRTVDFGGPSNRYHYGYFSRLLAVETICNSTSYNTNMITLPNKSGTMAVTDDIPAHLTTTAASSAGRWPGGSYSSDISHFVTPNDIYYWNGAVTGTTSYLAYCNQGAFGNIVTHAASEFQTAVAIVDLRA